MRLSLLNAQSNRAAGAPSRPLLGRHAFSSKGRPTQAVPTSKEDVDLRKNPQLYSLTASDEVLTSSLATKKIENFTSSAGRKKPEVLSPVGGWEQLRAAVENGADAVYFGTDDFNARQRASNFDVDAELPQVMKYLRERGVKGYVALNVLVFDSELNALEEHVKKIARAGVDAVIVQDIGVCEVIKRVAPNLHIHGSTQMSITSGEGAEFARKHAGVNRIVVGRELSIKEIERTRAGTEVEIECFVHGALCVSYSGQCFSSEAWGGRSANRGRCAQACRIPYGLIVNGTLKDLGDVKYLLSPQDLSAVEQVPDLIRAGVECFKIEGRLKGPEYVALTTLIYRQAVDAAWADFTSSPSPSSSSSSPKSSDEGKKELKPAKELPSSFTLDEETKIALQQVFARGQDDAYLGLTPGFLEGSKHQRLVRGRNPRHRGVYAGKVLAVSSQGAITIQSPIKLKRGDGLVFDAGTPEDREAGGTIFDIVDSRTGKKLEAASPELGGVDGRITLILNRPSSSSSSSSSLFSVQPGDLVWRNKDPQLEQKIRRTFDKLSDSEKRGIPVDVTVSGRVGEQVRITMRDDAGRSSSSETSTVLQIAENRPIDQNTVRDAIGNLGGTTLRLRELDLSGLELEKGVFLPSAALKSARRAASEELIKLQLTHEVAAGLATAPVLPQLIKNIAAAGENDELQSNAEETEPKLRVLCRTAAQVSAACSLDFIGEIIVDFLEVHGLKESVAEVKKSGKKVIVATPRIIKPGEERLVVFYLRLGADSLLIRSTGLLHQLLALGGAGAVFQGCTVPRLEGDFSLNASNVLTSDIFLNCGLDVLTPTHDLNAKQICDLAQGLGSRSSKLEVILHQHLPIFHTEHCVFCRTLSSGNSYLDCGHPCETNTVHLRDEKGRDNLVLADAGCRNTVFNAEAQSGLPFLEDFLSHGVQSFRVELVDEGPQSVAPLLKGYWSVLQGKKTWRELWAFVATLPDANGRPNGVGVGSLVVAQEQNRDEMKQTAYQKNQLDRERERDKGNPSSSPATSSVASRGSSSSSASSSAPSSSPRRGPDAGPSSSNKSARERERERGNRPISGGRGAGSRKDRPGRGGRGSGSSERSDGGYRRRW